MFHARVTDGVVFDAGDVQSHGLIVGGNGFDLPDGALVPVRTAAAQAAAIQRVTGAS